MTRYRVCAVALGVGIGCVLWPALGFAQARPAQPAASTAQSVAVRGFADIGALSFTAAESFEAVLGSRTGTLFGGGGEVVLPQGIFASLRASRFQKSGERVFVFEDETFGLGIETTIRVTPIEITGGYRFGHGTSRVVPYVGGGFGWHRFEETSEFATDDENVDETHSGYHLLGGAEVRVARWFGVGGEVQWTTVPDALGQDPNGASAAFDETNLGGVAFRVKFVVGR
jgi:opacity protein-like surface antigen